jgi:hypothetical protein
LRASSRNPFESMGRFPLSRALPQVNRVATFAPTLSAKERGNG